MKTERNILEKTTFYSGLFILTLLVGYLTYQWATAKEKQPPNLDISTTYETSLPGNSYKVEIKNRGQETAHAVNISFNLYQKGKIAESSVLNVDYVPVRSQETGWISFSKERTSSDSVVVGSKTYVEP